MLDQERNYAWLYIYIYIYNQSQYIYIEILVAGYHTNVMIDNVIYSTFRRKT